MWKKILRVCPCSCSSSKSDIIESQIHDNKGFQDDQESPGTIMGLGNSLILSKVFDFLPPFDLYSCRQVSLQWKREASKILRKKSEPIYLTSEDVPIFIKMMKNSLDNPYSRFALNLFDPSSSVSTMRTNCRTFFEYFNITLLILQVNEDDVPFIVPNLKYTAVTLQTLILIVSKSDSISSDNRRKISKSQNNLKLPSLTEVHFSINGDSVIDQFIIEILKSSAKIQIINFKKWQSCLENIFQHGDFENTRQLILNQSITNSQLQVLCNKLLNHLNYLEFGMIDIFKKTSTTLEILQVSHCGQYCAFYFPTPMLNLKAIVLKSWNGPILLDSVVLNCKGLEKLDIENFNPDNIVVHSTSQLNDLMKHHGLQRLGLLYDGNFPKRKIKGVLKRLLPKFPNIQDFYSAAETDDILELILSSISREMISIFLDFSMELSDGSLTGIPTDLLEASKEDDIERIECGCWVLKNPKTHRRHAYIGDLTKLQQLHISIEGGSQISNLSMHHGIADLKELKILRLYSKGIHWCLKCIGDNLPNLQRLYLKSQRLYRNDELAYLMEKIPGIIVEFSPDSTYSYLVQRSSIVPP